MSWGLKYQKYRNNGNYSVTENDRCNKGILQCDNGFYRILKSSLQSFQIGSQYKKSNSLFCSSQSQLSKCRVCRLDNKKGDHLCLKIKN